MTGKNKMPTIGFHAPSDRPDLVSRLRAQVKKRGGGRGVQSAILTQALSEWLDRNENGEDPE